MPGRALLAKSRKIKKLAALQYGLLTELAFNCFGQVGENGPVLVGNRLIKHQFDTGAIANFSLI